MNNAYKDILPKQFTVFPSEDMEGSIIARFRKIVAQYADQVAIKYKGCVTTYGSLDIASSALAALLINQTGPGKEPVAMMFKHGAGCHIAQFAVLKTGKFYAHLDGELGLDRQKLILGDLEARTLLCDNANESAARLLAAFFPGLLVLNMECADLSQAVILPDVSISPQDYAYIVYTSGSTGPAQGVILSHANVLQFTHHQVNYMHLHSDDRAAHICPLWTGASGAEIFPILLNGGVLFPYSVSDQGLPELTKLLIDEKLTIFTAVPTLFRMMMRGVSQETKFPDMRMIKLAGDRTTRVEVDLFKKHFMKTCLLKVGLGASEVMVFVHFFIDTEYAMTDEVAPVGYPLEGFEVLLVDDDLNEIRNAGEHGEIVVRSKYLSVGYWKNPGLTHERFLADPGDNDQRFYFSRDIGYRDEEGRLHHAGRKDSRVKIYGKMYLISDVEEALLAIEGVTEAIVVPFDSGERGTELTAYIVTENGYNDLPAIRQQLAAKVVAEIRPRTITILDAMPLHTNNKINRLQLRDFAKLPKESLNRPGHSA